MPKVDAEYREEKRRALIDATAACLDRNGIAGLSTRAITEEAGLAKGALYTYFDSKEALIIEVAKQRETEFLGAFLETFDPADSTWQDFFAQFLVVILSDPDDRQSPSQLSILERAMYDPAIAGLVRDHTEYYVEGMRPYVEAAQSEGVIRADIDARALTEMIALFANGVDLQHASGSFVTSFEAVSKIFLQVLLTGAAADPTIARAEIEGVVLRELHAQERRRRSRRQKTGTEKG